MSLTKNRLIEIVYEELDMQKKECANIIESLFEIIKEELIEGKDLMISEFGKWSVKHKRERIGRNPHTGKAMTIKMRKVVTFRSSLKLRAELNKKK